jgi:hypothetical protein
MTGSLIISMPIGQTNDGGVSMLRRTNIIDIYSKAKGLLLKMWLLYSLRQLLGVRWSSRTRHLLKKVASESKNERPSALP